MRDQALWESGDASQGCSRPAEIPRGVDQVHREGSGHD